MAVMSRQRPADPSGQGFLKDLASLRMERALKGPPACGSLPLCLWVPGRHPASEGPSQTATADCGEYHLLVVEMGDRYLDQAPACMPKVSWCLWGPNDVDGPTVGGPAPSFEDAKMRAELAMRARLGVTMDS